MPQPSALLLLLLVMVVEVVLGQQCTSSSDCTSPAAPHCSKWGWCQWTDRYGAEGPGQGGGQQDGRCEGPQDCTPRAPVCSNQGFCTERGKQPLPGPADRNAAARPRLIESADFNTEDDQLSEVVPNKRSFPSTDAQRPALANLPGIRAPPAKSQFVISEYDPDYAEYYGNYDILKQDKSEENNSALDSSIFGGNVELVTVAPLAANIGVDTRRHEEDDRDVVEDTAITEHGEESEGCLIDCVNDCVSITELRAYKDCVTFCGKTCD